MHRLVHHLRANLVAWVALFVALGGTSYAAFSLPRNSVGAAQLRNHSIDPVKLDPRAIGGSVRAWAIVRADGSVIAGSGQPFVGHPAGLPGFYDIRWGTVFPKTCATIGNVDIRSPAPTETLHEAGGVQNVIAGYVSGVATDRFHSGSHQFSSTVLNTFDQTGQPAALAFDVAIIC